MTVGDKPGLEADVSLRDGIAMLAMVGILAGEHGVMGTKSAKQGIAEDAYAMADQMLIQRTKKPAP